MNKQQTRAHYEGLRNEAQRQTPLQRVMEKYHCSVEDAQRYLDLREEGYGRYEAAIQAGIADPHD